MVMPSVKEGWCLAVTEAGAQGTPSVAYASAGGVRESIRDGETGVLVRDLDQLVDAVGATARATTPRRRALADGARQMARTLTWESCAAETEAVLRSVSSRGDQSP